MTDRTERRLWGLTAVLLALVCARVLVTLRDADPAYAPLVDIPAAVWQPGGSAGDAVRAVVSSNPFRDDRHAAPRPFGSADEPRDEGPALVRPLLRVTGIAGPPWSAIVEGFPGREQGTVVRPGDRVGALRVARISPDAVHIVGADTNWILPLTRAP